MNKFSLLMFAFALSAACSSDDDSAPVAVCDCVKVTYVYHEDQQVFEPTDYSAYSNNCNDAIGGHQPNGDGTYYSINCTEVE
jgi:hypothetical protein